MKLVIDRSVLLKSLGHVQSVVEKRGTIPILSNVRLEAREGALDLTATDMEIAVIETVNATVSQQGATTVPAQTFYEIVRKLPDGSQVEMVKDNALGFLIVLGVMVIFAAAYIAWARVDDRKKGLV